MIKFTRLNLLNLPFVKLYNLAKDSYYTRLFLLMTVLFSVTFSVYRQAGKNYQHWADGDAATGSTASWNNNILNANKSDYFEGEVIPHVAIIPASNNTPLVNGTNYTFTIVYNFWQSNTNAGGFAFITTYNISRQPTAFGTVTPALDPGGATGTGNQGVFYVGPGVDVISAAAPSTTTASGTKDQTVLVTFKWTGATTTSGSALIFFGLYIAEPGRVPNQGSGVTNGAHAWTGGSLQTTLNSTFTGGLSLQLSPAGIIAGSISGVKYKDLNKNGTKDAGEPLLSGWTIYLDKNNNGSLDAGEASTTTDANGAYSFSVTPDADKTTPTNDPYIVREILQSGWTQTEPAAGFYSVTITSLAPTAVRNFGNFICVNPTISTPAIGTVCAGATSASVSYSGTTGTPDQYRIDWNAAAEAAGLTDIAYTSLPASPFSITIPGTLAAGTYNGTIYVKNSTTGCESAGNAISLTVNAKPTASAGNAPAAQCLDAVNGNTFSLSGSGSNGTPSWAVQSNPNSLTVTFIPNPPNTFTPSVKITGGFGSVTLRLTVTSNTTPACGTATSDVTVTVNDKPAAPDVTYNAPACDATTFSVTVSGVISGATYTIVDKDGNAIPGVSPASPHVAPDNSDFSFSNIPAGSGYQVTVSTSSGCSSSATSCGSSSQAISKVSQVSASIKEPQTKVFAAPNPFNDRVRFTLESAVSGRGSLELYNMMGQKVSTVFQGYVQKGQIQTIQFSVPGAQRGALIYVFTVGDQRTSGKLIGLK